MDMMTIEMIASELNMDPATAEAAIAGGVAILSFAAVCIVISVIRYLLQAIGYAAMYRKAGVAPWKAFIPVYNTYNNYKLSWKGNLYFLYAALVIASGFFTFSEGVMALVGFVISIAIIYMAFKQNKNMAKLFGKGTGTAIALILFPGITSLILGLGKAEYTAIEA